MNAAVVSEGLRFRGYLGIRKPTVLRVLPSNLGVITYYFVGFGDTGKPPEISDPETLKLLTSNSQSPKPISSRGTYRVRCEGSGYYRSLDK